MQTKSLLKKHFSYLETHYGLPLRKRPTDKWEEKWLPSISYANEVTGVVVSYDVRDQFLSARIYRLVDGEFPMRNKHLDPTKGFSLNSIAFLVGPTHRVGSWRDENAASAKGELSFDEYVARVANLLRSAADDLLRGDFSRSEQIEQARKTIVELKKSSDA